MNESTARTVITIDDEPSIRMLIRMALQYDTTIEIIEAADGVEGLAALKAHRPALVLLDVVMPRKDGIETLQAMRADPELRTIPVILLTGFKDQKKLLPLLEQPNTTLLPKPFLVEMLRQMVQQVLSPLPAAAAS